MSVLLLATTFLLAMACAGLLVRLMRRTRRLAVAESRVAELARRADNAERARDRFLSSVTHELRTPLTAVLGYQEMLADGLYGRLDEKSREPVERIGVAAERLLSLVDRVLDIIRLETGQAIAEMEEVPARALVLEAVAVVRGMAEGRGAVLQLDLPDGLPHVVTDPSRLTRILALALETAIHAEAAARVRVSARSADGRVSIEVQGPRLDAHVPDLAHAATAREQGEDNIVLPLHVAQRLAKLLGVELHVRSDSRATTIKIRIARAAPVPVTHASA